MERAFIFSDLHGDVRQLEKISKRVTEEEATHVLFAGDMGFNQLAEHRDIFYALSTHLTTVRGNVDQPWVFMTAGIKVPLLYTSVPFCHRQLGLTHGDYYSTWTDLPIPLSDADVFITGHTHVPSLIKLKGQPALLNPGSASSSRSEYPESYAVIDQHSITIKSVEEGKQIGSFHLSF